MEDLDFACTEGKLPMKTSGADLGRASRTAALMLKARVVLYQKDQARYTEVTKDMAAIINSGQFRLMDDFDAMWNDENEFCAESIFETNQLPEGKTWSTGWQGYGTNFPAYISPNDLNDPAGVFKGGWGFAPVRQAAYDIFEAGDTRREGSINAWPAGSYGVRFQNTGLFLRKYAARVGYNPPPGDTDLNYCNNLRIYRYAETLLNYAELVGVLGASASSGVSGQSCFDQVRARAGVASISINQDNIETERHREFIGEGRRYWDLVRWGKAKTVLSENITEITPGGGNRPPTVWQWSRTWEDKDKYLPIPENEMNTTKGTANELVQNPGY
jgi:hypothetical protein